MQSLAQQSQSRFAGLLEPLPRSQVVLMRLAFFVRLCAITFSFRQESLTRKARLMSNQFSDYYSIS
jgi:hypothetical protein